MQPEMLQHIVMSELLPYLQKYSVLTINEEQLLQLVSTTNYKKVQDLLSLIISKGPEGEKNFIIALYESSKKQGNSGHKELIAKLQHEGITVVKNRVIPDILSANFTTDTSSIDDPSANSSSE